MPRRIIRTGRVRVDARLKALTERVRHAMRLAGASHRTIRNLSVRYWEYIQHTDTLCQGLCSWPKGVAGRCYLDVVVDGEEASTLIHEAAHAFLGPAQGDRYQGESLDPHCPIWRAAERRITEFFYEPNDL